MTDKRSAQDVFGGDASAAETARESKRNRSGSGYVPPMPSTTAATTAPGILSQADKIKAMIAKSKAQIAARMAGQGIAMPPQPPPTQMPQGPPRMVAMDPSRPPPPLPPPQAAAGGAGPGLTIGGKSLSEVKASIAARVAAAKVARHGGGMGGMMQPPPVMQPGMQSVHPGMQSVNPGMRSVYPGMRSVVPGNQSINMFSGLQSVNPMGGKPIAKEDRPQALILDKEGRMVDASGKEIKFVKRAPEFKANITRDNDGGADGKGAGEAGEEVVENAVFDERLPQRDTERTRRSFNFKDQGHYVEMASKKRARQKLEKLSAEIAITSKKTGIAAEAKLAMMAPSKKNTEDLMVPDIEWWDASILKNKSYDNIGESGTPPGLKNVSHLIQHPIPVEPPAEPAESAALPIMLTKKERKKLRTQRRKAEEKEKTEKIRLGLLEAPAPKVKKANFMRVLGLEAVADPTKVEAIVNAQSAIRDRNHTAHNNKQALTAEQKKEKLAKQLTEDTSLEVQVAVFRINELRDEKKKYKVNVNAKQYNLTGCAVMTDTSLNVIVVEGGAKGLKKYKRLMLHRIKWSDDEDEMDSDDEDAKPPNKCVLVWEGKVQKRSFEAFEMKVCKKENFAREYFRMSGVPQYWDLSHADSVTEQSSR